MFPLLLILAFPATEIYLFVETGKQVGAWLTIGMIFATALVGGMILRHQGRQMIARAREQVAKEELPVAELAHGAVLVLAAFLLLTPGFITDALGTLLLIPVLRRLVLGAILVAIRSRVNKFDSWGGPSDASHGSTVIDGDFKDISGSEADGTPAANGKRTDGD